MNKKRTRRVRCPYCDELISPNAKKCRYCKENLTTNPEKPYRLLYRNWFISMLSFFILTFIIRRMDAEAGIWIIILGLLAFVVIAGIAFFIKLFRKIINHFKTDDAKLFGVIGVATFFAFFYLLINIDSVEARLGFSPPENRSANTEQRSGNNTPIVTSPTPSPSTTPAQNVAPKNTTSTTNSNQVDCIGPDGKRFNTSMDECKNLNEKWSKPVDYMVTCHIPSECGGGSKYIPKSECDKPCTPTNSGNNNSANYQTTPSSSASYYCYNNYTDYWYYTTSGEQCNADNTKSACLSIYESSYDLCMDSCLSDAHDSSAYCIYNLSGAATDECLAEKDMVHQNCMDSCGDEYSANSASCY